MSSTQDRALEGLCLCCEGLSLSSHAQARRGRFLLHAEGDEDRTAGKLVQKKGAVKRANCRISPSMRVARGFQEQLLLVAQLFLRWPGGPKRLPRPSELLFGGPDVPLAEVEAGAFDWRAAPSQ